MSSEEGHPVEEEDYSELDNKINAQRLRDKANVRVKGAADSKNYRVDCTLKVVKVKFSDLALGGEDEETKSTGLRQGKSIGLQFEYGGRLFSTSAAKMGKKTVFGDTFELQGIHNKLKQEGVTQMLVLKLVSYEALSSSVVGKSEGIFFEDLIITTVNGIEEEGKAEIFTKSGAKLGILEYTTTLSSIGNPPKHLQQQIMRNRQILEQVGQNSLQNNGFIPLDDQLDASCPILDLNFIELKLINLDVAVLKPSFMVQYRQFKVSTPANASSSQNPHGDSIVFQKPMNIQIRIEDLSDNITCELFNCILSSRIKQGSCIIKISDIISPKGSRIQWFTLYKKEKIIASVLIQGSILDPDGPVQKSAENLCLPSMSHVDLNNEDQVQKSVPLIVKSNLDFNFQQEEESQLAQTMANQNNLYDTNIAPLVQEKPNTRIFKSHQFDLEFEKDEDQMKLMDNYQDDDEMITKRDKNFSREKSKKSVKSMKSTKSKKTNDTKDDGTKNPTKSGGGNEFAGLLGGNIDDEKLQQLKMQFVALVQSGQLEQFASIGQAEPPSYKKLLKTIAEKHPVDPTSKLKFSIKDRITVKDYDSKLSDLFYFYYTKKYIKNCCKRLKKKIKGNHGIQFVKPESLKDVPDSSTSSSGSDDGEDAANGLTVCATKLGDGATLYLQSMKTMMIMFFILSFINIPILLMYQSNTENNQYFDIFSSTFQYYTLGNMGQTNEKCGFSSMDYLQSQHDDRRRLKQGSDYNLSLVCPTDTYISEIKHFGFLYKEDKRTRTFANGHVICSQINTPDAKIDDQYFIEFVEEDEDETEDDHNNSQDQNDQEEEKVEVKVVEKPLPAQIQKEEGSDDYDFCSSQCLHAGYSYCVNENFDHKFSLCFETHPEYSYFDVEAGKMYNVQQNNTDQYHCRQHTHQGSSLEFLGCPNHPVCTEDSIIKPQYGKDVKYMNSFGFQPLKRFDELEIQQENTFCFFWIKPNPKMTDQDLLWLELSSMSEMIDIQIFMGPDSEDFPFIDTVLSPIPHQAISVDRNSSILVKMEWEADAELEDVLFKSWINTIDHSNEYDFYTPEMMQYNLTIYNIDTQCYNENLFNDNHTMYLFKNFFYTECLNKQTCSFNPLDERVTLDKLISNECIYRITELEIASSDFILVIGCKQDWIRIIPFTDVTIGKHSAGLLLVIIEIICVMITTFFFSKLKNINEEYMELMDDLTVQIKDFGIMFENVALDKYSQDSNLIRMKLWLHLYDQLRQKRTRDNKMEIIDITFSMFNEPHIQCVFRMQEVQEKINEINNSIYKGDIPDDGLDSAKSQIDQLELKMKRLKDRYRQLISRGNHFTKEEIRHRPKSQRTNQIRFVFVLFKNCLTSDVALNFLAQNKGVGSWLKQKLFDSKIKRDNTFCGHTIKAKPIIDPNEIIWQNFAFIPEEQYIRLIFVYIIGVLFVLGNLITYVYFVGLQTLVVKKVPNYICPDQPVTDIAAYEDYKMPLTNGLMECYCSEHTSLLKFWTYITVTFHEIQYDDNRRYCLEIAIFRLGKTIVLGIISIMVVLINELISKIFLRLGQYTKVYTKIQEQSISFKQIFTMEFINMGLIALINGFEFSNITKLLLGQNELFTIELHSGFTPNWYKDIGQYICFSLFVSSFAVNMKEIAIFIYKEAKRCRDRGFKLRMKKDLEDEDDDQPNTKLKVQKELEELYTGKEFEGEKAFSRMMSTLFVILMYSSGMPILYVIGAFFYGFTYFVSKALIIKFYRTSTTLSRTIPKYTMEAVKYGIILHLATGFMMITNPIPFQTSNILSVEESGSSWLDKIFPKVDPLEQIKEFEEQQLGESQITSSTLVVGFLQRFQYRHQQLYLIFLIFFTFMYLVWKSVYGILEFIITTIIYIFKKLYQSMVRCFNRLVKRIKCTFEGTVYIDTEESKLFTDSDESSEKEDEEEASNDDETDMDTQANIKLEQLKEKRKSVCNYELRGEMTPNKKLLQDQLEEKISSIENAIQRKVQKKQAKQLKKEQRIARKKELENLLRQKRMARQDFSPNMLFDISTTALASFYERSKKELCDFLDVFHCVRELPEEMIDPESKSPLRTSFIEFCFINHITSEQVVRYQKILKKRIRDIEQVIDAHFKMIHQNLIDDVKEIFEKEKKKRKKEGIELTLQQQMQFEEDERNALIYHPDIQFDNPQCYPYSKKLKKLQLHEEDLIKNDIARMENRRGIQEICRMERNYTQSYFIFDSDDYKIAREIYFGIDPKREVEDDEFIGKMMGDQGSKPPKKKEEDDDDYEDSSNDSLESENRTHRTTSSKKSSKKSSSKKSKKSST